MSLAGNLAGFGFEDSSLVGCIGSDSGVKLLLGDDVLLDERSVALDVEVRLGGVGFGGGDACLCCLSLFAGLLHGGG